jgi:hypothetical protein
MKCSNQVQTQRANGQNNNKKTNILTNEIIATIKVSILKKYQIRAPSKRPRVAATGKATSWEAPE